MNAIDTNVFVYAVDYNESLKQPIAERLIRDARDGGDTVLLW